MPLRISACQALASDRYRAVAACNASSNASPVYSLNLKPVPFRVCRIELLDRVVESAGGAHHRYGSIAHAVDLVQPAGLVARGHQEDVAARFNLVRQGIVIGDLHGEFLRILLVQLAEQLFILAVAAAQHHHDQVLPGQAIGHLENQIESLLGGKARHDSHHRQLRVFRQAKFLQQVGFAFCLAAEVIG